MLMGLMKSGISVKNYVCSDINSDLISLWNNVKDNPNEIFGTYKKLWTELNKDDDTERKKKFFEQQRKIYNETHNPFVFFFIMRTTTNGMPRYNKNGEFNNSFHVTRNGIIPEIVYPIIMEWSWILNKNNVVFKHCSYEKIKDNLKDNDFVYMDPPYFNTKGMYFGAIDFDSFFGFLETLSEMNIKFALSFNGKSGEMDNTYSIPESCYKRHFYIKSGNSSFKRTIGKDRNSMVYESLYLNYNEEKTGLFDIAKI